MVEDNGDGEALPTPPINGVGGGVGSLINRDAISGRRKRRWRRAEHRRCLQGLRDYSMGTLVTSRDFKNKAQRSARQKITTRS